MVIFNELRIKEDRSGLIVDCSVEGLAVYENMYISKIEVYHYKNTDSYGAPIDTSKVITLYDNTVPDTTVKSVRRCLSESALATSVLGVSEYKNGIFYVRVTCDGTLGADISQYACGTDNPVDIGIVPDWMSLYNSGMGLIARLAGCHALCDPNTGYEQFIMNWFAIRLAMSACDYDGLAEAWDRYFRISTCSGAPSTVSGNGCGCR
ncbi:MAG: hypothetical protein II661_01565 [Bacteroidales bacterium]|nr:hypothetical protein [Bacteroidales bacterium]